MTISECCNGVKYRNQARVQVKGHDVPPGPTGAEVSSVNFASLMQAQESGGC